MVTWEVQDSEEPPRPSEVRVCVAIMNSDNVHLIHSYYAAVVYKPLKIWWNILE